MKRYYIFIGLLVLVAVAATVAQSFMGRSVKTDQGLTQNISDFDTTIQDYALAHNALPQSNQVPVPGDVAYSVTGREAYELCGTFLTENRDPNPSANVNVPGTIDATYHGKGYQCFNGSVSLPNTVIEPAPKPSVTPTVRPIIQTTPQGAGN
ncbi:MAG TPA: hypothetical protein VGH44_00160 [Candidatus Saccharimonadia bacterium]|jgi:hypothetical protein